MKTSRESGHQGIQTCHLCGKVQCGQRLGRVKCCLCSRIFCLQQLQRKFGITAVANDSEFKCPRCTGICCCVCNCQKPPPHVHCKVYKVRQNKVKPEPVVSPVAKPVVGKTIDNRIKSEYTPMDMNRDMSMYTKVKAEPVIHQDMMQYGVIPQKNQQNHMNPSNQVNQVNQVNPMNMNASNPVNPVNRIGGVNHFNPMNTVNTMNAMNLNTAIPSLDPSLPRIASSNYMDMYSHPSYFDEYNRWDSYTPLQDPPSSWANTNDVVGSRLVFM